MLAIAALVASTASNCYRADTVDFHRISVRNRVRDSGSGRHLPARRTKVSNFAALLIPRYLPDEVKNSRIYWLFGKNHFLRH
jgi:hypothetical protein